MPNAIPPMILSFATDVLRLGIWLMLLAAIFVPVERFFALHDTKIMRAGFWADLGYYFLSSLLPGFILSLPFAFVATLAHQYMPWPIQSAINESPLWMKMVAGLLIGELGAYWGHRLSHEIPFLWQFHEVHHKPGHIDWLVNTHTHPVDMVFTRICALTPLYALGLGGGGSGSSVVPALVLIVGALWGFFIHANVRWRFGPLEWLVATPAFHHWHHTLDGPINRNYASMLPWLDRLFGTHHLPPDAWPTEYGVLPPAKPGQQR